MKKTRGTHSLPAGNTPPLPSDTFFLFSRALFIAALATAAFFLYLLRDFPRVIDPLLATCIAVFLLASVWRTDARTRAHARVCAFDIAVLVWVLQFFYRVIAGVQLYANAFYYADTLKIDADDAVGSMLQYMAHAHQTNLITVIFQILCGLIFFLGVVMTFVPPLMSYASNSIVGMLPYAASCFSAALFMATVPYGNRFALSDDALFTFVFRTVIFLGAVLVEQHNLNAPAATIVARYMWLLFLTPYVWFLGIGVLFTSLFVTTLQTQQQQLQQPQPQLQMPSRQRIDQPLDVPQDHTRAPMPVMIVVDEEKREKNDLEMTQIDLGSTNTIRRRALSPHTSRILALFDAKCTALIDSSLRIYGASVINAFREALLVTEQQNGFQFIDDNDDVIQMQERTYNTYGLFDALLQQYIEQQNEHVVDQSDIVDINVNIADTTSSE